MVKHRRKSKKSWNQWVATILMIASTTIIVFNNVGQSFQLFQVDLSRNAIYWIAGICLLVGIVWESYLNKIIRL